MARLTPQDIIARIKSPGIGPELNEAMKHDKRVCFHTEPTLTDAKLKYLKEYLEWVNTILDDKKHDVFKHLLTLPIETVDFTEGVLNELRKALCAQDKHVSYSLTSNELIEDYSKYLKAIGDEMFWDSEAFTAMKSNINAVMVVDLPKLEVLEGEPQQQTKYANPYYYLIGPEKIVDAKIYKTGQIDWIIFKGNTDNIYYCFDDLSFQEIVYQDGKVISISEVGHELGRCPARMFWSTPFNKDSTFQRRGPVSNSIAKLDWLLFCTTSTRHATLYAGFPIYTMYEQKCGYKDDEGNVCENGLVIKNVRVGSTDQWRQQAENCPSCKGKKILGAGSVFTAPARRRDGDPDLLQGISVTGAQTDDLKWLEESIDRQELGLQWNMIGVARELSNDAAKNEMQVSSGFESRMNVIMWVKTNFEIAHKWILETVGQLRYGASFMAANVNYGTRFYLYEPDELIKEYDLSKKSGLPNFELSSQIDQILNTKYRTNPNMQQRVNILKELEPYLTYTLQEMNSLPGKADEKQLTLKKNFDDFISRFEREFTDVVSFLPFADFDKKIDTIKEFLMSYVEELYVEESAGTTTETTSSTTTEEPVVA